MKESTQKSIEQALNIKLQNLSYFEVSQKMNRPVGTIKRWLAPYRSQWMSSGYKNIKQNALKGNIKAKERFAKLREDAYNSALNNAEEDLKNPFLRDFVNMYIGEGSKRRESEFSIINSDPKIILLSLAIIKKYFFKANKKITLSVRYYKENNNEKELLNYWSNIIDKDDSITIKTYIQPTVKAIVHNNSNKFGLVRDELFDTYAKQRLNAYMDYLKDEWTQEFENTFNTKVDRSIIEVKAEAPIIVERSQIPPTKKSIHYPAMPILKQMVAEKGYSQVAKELDCSLEAVRKYIFRNDDEYIPAEKKKNVYPETHELIAMVAEKGYVQVGKELGCSDNAIRKYLKKNKIDLTSIV